MLTAFLLGLIGSVTHCVGMCSGVMVVLGRGADGRGRLLLHLGRLTTYALLGALAGGVGSLLVGASGHNALTNSSGHEHAPAAALPAPLADLSPWQGVMALLGALAAGYMAVALLGWAPSPERWLGRATRLWGRVARGRVGAGKGMSALFLAGLVWGLLPCGLVMAALLPAAMSGSAGRGALTMLLFGLGTWPLGFSLGALAAATQQHLRHTRLRERLRPLGAALMLLVGVQMALRGLAAWGWASHLHLGGLMLW
ncbi:MAG: sulfite exporter TauE/SafE family protein [Anaerolineae bacterium]|nr:sulfite exporter TauE/SafE family protein [Caldilineales bacterium]MCX7852755.1 sulfite exporter TauE/SafE family protein [Caldilineales bacterium]MDW8268647.1 sulfite exporter TauE/SafE family protein [Anaerolineae bacterium]